MAQFRFSVAPWNVEEGMDMYGPAVRDPIPLSEKLREFSSLGFDAVQFHDDDIVADIDDASARRITEAAAETRRMVEDNGLEVESVAPRLWESRFTVDGALTSSEPGEREYALDRAYKAVDLAREMGTDLVSFWFAREGTVCPESKDTREGVVRIRESINKLLEYDEEIRISIEPKPYQPTDHSFVPTAGHAVALANQTSDPARVGVLVNSAHAILGNLDPAEELAFTMACGRVFSVHLNDQGGPKFEQHKVFGVEHLRRAFNQIRVLVENGYGSRGEFVGVDARAMRTQPQDRAFRHLENSLRVIRFLEEQARAFDYGKQKAMIDARDFEALEMYVMELLTGLPSRGY